MTEKKTREDYPDDYSFRADNLWKEVKTSDDEGFPKVISYFCKQGVTPITGKVFKPPLPDFKCECDIKECFSKIKEKMHTKGGQLRASMLKLTDYEVQDWAQLLEYLRSEWQLGNRGKVLLTKKEWFMLFGVKNKKK